MPEQLISENSRRIARNTVLLYFRMFLLMIIGLFTSRIVLRSLGFDNMGIYNVVGSAVTMFLIVTQALTTAISRFITFSLGEGDPEKSKRVFSTSLIIVALLAVVIIALGESLGLVYVHKWAVIPQDRIPAAVWVLHASLAVLVINLFSVPFNAEIIAHEHMKAFAYISIVEALLKLSVALCLALTIKDTLIVYAVLLVLVALIIRGLYAIYCRRYDECKGSIVFDRRVFKDMFAFAGWNFFGVVPSMLNTHGVGIATNQFFSLAVNAARNQTTQVEGIVRQFVNSFTTALNPQITKSYAEGKTDYCFHLVCTGARYSWLLMLFFAIPILFESDMLMRLWLGNYPEYTDVFVKIAIFAQMADMMGSSLAVLAMATGNVRRYYLVVGGLTLTVLPLSILFFAMGASPAVSYAVYLSVYALLIAVKCMLMKRQVNFPASRFFKEVILRILPVTAVAIAVTAIVWYFLPAGWLRLLLVVLTSTLSIAGFTWLWGSTPGERAFALSKIIRK